MCGIAAIVEVKEGHGRPVRSLAEASADVEAVLAGRFASIPAPGSGTLAVTDAGRGADAGGEERIDRLTEWARGLKRSAGFAALVTDAALRTAAGDLAARLRAFADAEDAELQAAAAALDESDVELFSARLLRVRDVAWH